MKKTVIAVAVAAIIALIGLAVYLSSSFNNKIREIEESRVEPQTFAFYNLDKIMEDYDFVPDFYTRLERIKGRASQKEIDEELMVMKNIIHDDIRKGLLKYNETYHYTMIFATSSSGQNGYLSIPVSLGDEAVDITKDLLDILNVDYLARKKK